jgi:hypothetical protein
MGSLIESRLRLVGNRSTQSLLEEIPFEFGVCCLALRTKTKPSHPRQHGLPELDENGVSQIA